MRATDARARKALVSFGATALLAIGAATAQIAMAAATPPAPTGIDASGSYQHEVQSCLSGHTQQDQATCLREARNAHAEKERGRLQVGGDFRANAMERCDVFQTSEDKAACQARVLGMGPMDGSVASGGVLREAETVVLPQGQHAVTVQPQTNDTIVLVPNDTSVLGNRAQ
jgi:hypothetical protein